MVYAPYGRAGIYMLQEFCRQLDIEAKGTEIRDLIGALRMLPAGHPLQGLLSKTQDFRNQSALADALLHPQDRAYSVPQFFELIAKGGLRFGRWIRQAPYSVHCGVMTKIPQSSRIARLPPAEQYAMAELFRGTMVRHSAIVYADGTDEFAKPQLRHAEKPNVKEGRKMSHTRLVMSDDTSVPILRAIHGAKKSICVKVFLFSDPELLGAVIEAKKRGVNVRVMLNPARRSGESENEEAASSRKTGRDRVGHGGIQFRPGVPLQSIRSTSFHEFSRS